MSVANSILLVLLLGADAASAPPQQTGSPQFVIDLPEVVLTSVPVDHITITARNAEGKVDETFNGRPLIRGIRLTTQGRESALPAFENGVLELSTDLKADRKVYVTDSEILVDPDSRNAGRAEVSRIWRWLALLPPLMAIGLAVWLRNIFVALFAGIWAGGIVLAHGNLWVGLLRSLDTYVLQQLASVEAHLMIILFTLFLGALVGVMSGSGGTTALVNRLSRFTKRREHGQLLTCGLGMAVFFDDYANTLLVGGTMRPTTDRLRISREKLAFLVDSTAAPIAGLAVISTWVGVEVGYIQSTFHTLGIEADGYTTFLVTLPYRFYALYLLVFVLLVAYRGRDYGPMLKAEARALATGHVHRPDASVPKAGELEHDDSDPPRPLLRNVLVPIGTLLVMIVAGLWWTGSQQLAAANLARLNNGEQPITVSTWSVLEHSDANQVLFVSSFVASVLAVLVAAVSRSLSLTKATEAWVGGAKNMFVALTVLVLAWGLAAVCDADHLNTAGFLVELTQGELPAAWMPTLAFLLSAAISLATGSSWSTMGLLMPLCISMTYYLMLDLNETDPQHPIMLATIGAVLAGSIFGDHCSPISDTTVLSSAASGCDHLDHVLTQMPYALSVGFISVVLGYLPTGFGYSPVVLLPLGTVALYLLVQFVGSSPEEYAKRFGETEHDDGPIELGSTNEKEVITLPEAATDGT